MKKCSIRKLAVLALTMLILLAGCAEPADTEKTSTAGNLPAETELTKLSCEEESTEVATVYVQMDINPSFILGMTGDCRVLSIKANNEDAQEVIENSIGDYFEGVENGVELENVIKDLAAATKQSGYIEDSFDVSVTVLSGSMEEDTFETACDNAKVYLSENVGITASFERVTDEGDDISGETEEITAETEQDNTCDLCHGECTIVCDLCEGKGEMTEIEERETEVRNDYVCPYCGGVGMIDDGMHGGETAVCGYCGGDGKTGSMSGEFREKAYEIKIVQEEVIRPCSRCGGSGILTCPHCEGTGIID